MRPSKTRFPLSSLPEVPFRCHRARAPRRGGSGGALHAGARALILPAFAALALAGPAAAGDYFVPSVTPTLQAAVALAEVSGDKDNTIWIDASPISTGFDILLDESFNADHHLVIRPIATLGRAVISNSGPGYIFELSGASNITLQDLDIVRSATNMQDLVYLHYHDGNYVNQVLIQRCRIGSIWNSTGVDNKVYMRITDVQDVTVRNCVFFALVAGTVDRGIVVNALVDPAARLRFYNNTVADYQFAGLRVDSDAGDSPDAVVVVRNNVTFNHPILGLDPIGYVSFVAGPTIVRTSHNTAFAVGGQAGFVAAGATDIAGFATGTTFVLPPADVDDSFFQFLWDPDPPFDPNPSFWHLQLAGPLHDDDPADYGVDVADGFPAAEDKAVSDDIDREARPGPASHPHTDRGADQADPGATLAVGPRLPGAGVLQARALGSPGRALEVGFASQRAGRLELEVFDLTGRRLDRQEANVGAGQSGQLRAPAASGSRVVFYLARLTEESGARHEVTGRAVLLR